LEDGRKERKELMASRQKSFECLICGTTDHEKFYTNKGTKKCKDCILNELKQKRSDGGAAASSGSAGSSGKMVMISEKQLATIMRRLENLDEEDIDDLSPNRSVTWRKSVNSRLSNIWDVYAKSIGYSEAEQMCKRLIRDNDDKFFVEINKLTDVMNGVMMDRFREETRDIKNANTNIDRRLSELEEVDPLVRKMMEDNTRLTERVEELSQYCVEMASYSQSMKQSYEEMRERLEKLEIDRKAPVPLPVASTGVRAPPKVKRPDGGS
jgi:DNA-binding HxlR family transcriptional regulator